MLEANPEYVFLEIGNLGLVLEQAQENPEYFEALQAVKDGKVYSLSGIRYYSTNVELMLANCYQVGMMVFPDAYDDVDPNAKLDEITQFFLGQGFSEELAAEGLNFRQIDILAEAQDYVAEEAA